MTQNNVIDCLDCCSQPILATITGLGDLINRFNSLRRCGHCGAYWFCKELEHGEAEYTRGFRSCYIRLTGEEANRLLASPHHPNLAHLEDHESILTDGRRVIHTLGRLRLST